MFQVLLEISESQALNKEKRLVFKPFPRLEQMEVILVFYIAFAVDLKTSGEALIL